MSEQDRASLLAAVLRDPDDDIARLIYADHLIAAGDPRGEFIRLDCALSGRPDPSRRSTMAERRELLLKQHGDVWRAPFRSTETTGNAEKFEVRFQRGFVSQLTISATALPFVVNKAWTSEPVTLLELTGDVARGLGVIAARNVDSGLRTLRFRAGNHRALAVLASPAGRLAFQRVQHINFSGLELDDGQHTLLKGLWLPQLRSMTWTGHELGDGGLNSLAAADALSHVTDLYLTSCGVGDDGVSALASSANARALRRLSLSDNEGVGNVAVTALASMPNMRALQALDLSRTGVNNDGIKALLNSSTLTSLRSLTIRGVWRLDRALMTALGKRYALTT